MMSKDNTGKINQIDFVLSSKEGYSALCLSGGGIRSATFCLGVIQGLATKGWLDKFDYLSTVSGGGYIGSWLSSWIHHAEQVERAKQNSTRSGLEVVTSSLRDSSASEPEEIKRLRQYSNYLSPVAGMSADMFALISIYCRNLFLNWLVLLPLLATIVVLPMLSLALVGFMASATSTPMGASLALGGMAAVVCIAYITSDLPDGNRHQTTKNHFLCWCLVPLIIGCWLISLVFQKTIIANEMLSWTESWHNIKSWHNLIPTAANTTNILTLALGGAMVHMVGTAVGGLYRTKRDIVNKKNNSSSTTAALSLKLKHWALGILFVLLSGAVGAFLLGMSAYAAQEFFKSYAPVASVRNALLATVSVPIILLCFHIGTAIYAAMMRPLALLMGSHMDEGPREWWGRSGGYCLLIGLLWVVAHVLVLWLPAYLVDLKTWVASVGGVGGLITVLCGYFGKNSSLPAGQELKSKWTTLGGNMLSIVAALFIIALIVGASLSWVYVVAFAADPNLPLSNHDDYLTLVVDNTPFCWLLALLISGVITFFFRVVVGVNTFSMQSLYCNRLTRAYLGATRSGIGRNPHAFTGFDPDDDLPLSSLSKSGKLKHIINAALNISQPAPDQLQYQQRKALPFSFASDQCSTTISGKDYSIGTDCYAGGILLGRAMAISGAAASPNMGYHTSPLVAFVLTFFNVRLGGWLPNPSKPTRAQCKAEPSVFEPTLFAELFGTATSARDFVYLSDGGHFENLGLYEVIRRQINAKVASFGTIVVVDASCDPEFVFDDLESCIRKMRVDLGVDLDFEQGLPMGKDGYAKEHYAIGELQVAGEPKGRVIYIKPVLTGDEPEDVLRYAARSKKQNKLFPHHSTADQFFDEAQFESYRILGLRSVDSFPVWAAQSGVPSATVKVTWPLHYRSKKQNHEQLIADDPIVSPLLKQIVGSAPTVVSNVVSPTGALAGLAALIAIPPLANLINSKSAENLFVFLPEQRALVVNGLNAVNVIFADAQRRIAFPLFPEGGYVLSAAAIDGLDSVAEALQNCPVDAHSRIEIDVQGFSSSSRYANQTDEGGSKASNILLADRRACVVWEKLHGYKGKPVNLIYRLNTWLEKGDKSDEAFCADIMNQDFTVSDDVAAAYAQLDAKRKVDTKKLKNNEEVYDEATGQLNRRVDLLPTSNLGKCSVREISATVSKGYGSWHGVLE